MQDARFAPGRRSTDESRRVWMKSARARTTGIALIPSANDIVIQIEANAVPGAARRVLLSPKSVFCAFHIGTNHHQRHVMKNGWCSIVLYYLTICW